MSSVLQLILEGERLDTAQMAQVLNLSEAEVAAQLERLQAEKILLGWRPVLNPERAQEDIVRAVIEVRISPERDGGFDRLAARISQFEAVESCYLMSGAYDLLIFAIGKDLREVALFVSERRLDEGSATTEIEVKVDPSIDRDRVSFEQGDAQSIREDIGQFDAVIACNLICRLPEPMRLLSRLPELIKPGGQLFITTPFTWLEEYTPSDNWLGDGAQDSFAGLTDALLPAFSLNKRWDMPFLIREHARKFQYSIAQASIWSRVV